MGTAIIAGVLLVGLMTLALRAQYQAEHEEKAIAQIQSSGVEHPELGKEKCVTSSEECGDDSLLVGKANLFPMPKALGMEMQSFAAGADYGGAAANNRNNAGAERHGLYCCIVFRL